MDVKSILFGLSFLVFIESGVCIKCYQCDSRVDKQCGITFEVANPMSIEKECAKNAIGCRKSVADMIDNEDKIIIRGCFNDSSTVNYTYTPDDKKCREEWLLTTCYCKGDLCNGQNTLLINASLFFGLLSITAIFSKNFS